MAENLSITDVRVFPASTSPNNGNVMTEYNVKSLVRSVGSRNFIVDGLTCEKDSSSYYLNTGRCFINGYFVEVLEKINITDLITTSGVLFINTSYSTNSDESETEQHLSNSTESNKYSGINLVFNAVSSGKVSLELASVDTNNYLPLCFIDYDTSEIKTIPISTNKLNSSDIDLSYFDNTLTVGDTIDDTINSAKSMSPLYMSSNYLGSIKDSAPTNLKELIEYLNTTYVRRYYAPNLNDSRPDAKYGTLRIFDKTDIEEEHDLVHSSYLDINYNGFEFKQKKSDNGEDSYKDAFNIETDENYTKLIINVDNLTNRTVEVIGDLTAERVFNAVYNDYAELYKLDDGEYVMPGDLIELNPDTLNYRKCINALSDLVVGVVSDTYGHLLGGDKNKSLSENLDSYAPIGISGRVYVKVSSENIYPGDLLVSSGNGYVSSLGDMCKKYGPVNTQGKIVGKCLSNIKDGKVLMQIMLG